MQVYLAQSIADRIKLLSDNLLGRRKVNELMAKCGLATSTVDNLRKGSMISADKLAIIADYLECSTDYLLGRTKNQKLNFKLNFQEEELICSFRKLSNSQRTIIIERIEQSLSDNKH